MLNVNELITYYPERERKFRSFILREYLQYKILQIVFDQQDYANQLCFLGGTCLRIVYGNNRFSDDIDFDNFSLNGQDFEIISHAILKELKREGYDVEIKTVYRGAFHCYVRFPGLLFKEGLAGHKEQKILIQLDAEPQHFDFQPDMHILNKFDVFTEIPVTPLPIILVQKFNAIINRKRPKGRDFFDTVFLLSREIRPDYDYLTMKLGINDPENLKDQVLDTCSKLNMKNLADDVAPFLFTNEDARKVTMFEQYIKQVEL